MTSNLDILRHHQRSCKFKKFRIEMTTVQELDFVTRSINEFGEFAPSPSP